MLTQANHQRLLFLSLHFHILYTVLCTTDLYLYFNTNSNSNILDQIHVHDEVSFLLGWLSLLSASV